MAQLLALTPDGTDAASLSKRYLDSYGTELRYEGKFKDFLRRLEMSNVLRLEWRGTVLYVKPGGGSGRTTNPRTMCTNFAADGSCSFGDTCRYTHGAADTTATAAATDGPSGGADAAEAAVTKEVTKEATCCVCFDDFALTDGLSCGRVSEGADAGAAEEEKVAEVANSKIDQLLIILAEKQDALLKALDEDKASLLAEIDALQSDLGRMEVEHARAGMG